MLGRATSSDIDPVVLSFFRWSVAGLVFLPFAVVPLLKDWPVIRQHWQLLILMGVLGVGGYNTFVYLGLQHTTATTALLINSFIPIFIIAISRVFLGERLGMRKSLAILISGLGVAILLLQGSLSNLMALRIEQGALWIVLASFTWAVYSISLRWRPPQLSARGFLLFTIICGVLSLSPFYVWGLWQGRTLEPTPTNLLTVAYVALFASIGAFLLWNQGVKLVGAATAGQFIHLMPLIGTLLAVVLLGESLHWFHGIGAVAIFGGVALALTPSANGNR